MSMPCQSCFPAALTSSVGPFPYTLSGTELTVDLTGTAPGPFGGLAALGPATSRFCWKVGEQIEIDGYYPALFPMGKIASVTASTTTLSGITFQYVSAMVIALPAYPTTGNVYPGSTRVDDADLNTSGLLGGEGVDGEGIPSGTKVASILDTKRFELSKKSTLPAAANEGLTFTPAFTTDEPPVTTRPATGFLILGNYVPDTTGYTASTSAPQPQPGRTCNEWNDVTNKFTSITLALNVNHERETTGTNFTSTESATGSGSVTLRPSTGIPGPGGPTTRITELTLPSSTFPWSPGLTDFSGFPILVTDPGAVESGAFRVLQCADCCARGFYLFVVNPPPSLGNGTYTIHEEIGGQSNATTGASTTTVTVSDNGDGTYTTVTDVESSSVGSGSTGTGGGDYLISEQFIVVTKMQYAPTQTVTTVDSGYGDGSTMTTTSTTIATTKTVTTTTNMTHEISGSSSGTVTTTTTGTLPGPGSTVYNKAGTGPSIGTTTTVLATYTQLSETSTTTTTYDSEGNGSTTVSDITTTITAKSPTTVFGTSTTTVETDIGGTITDGTSPFLLHPSVSYVDVLPVCGYIDQTQAGDKCGLWTFNYSSLLSSSGIWQGFLPATPALMDTHTFGEAESTANAFTPVIVSGGDTITLTDSSTYSVVIVLAAST